MPWIALSLLLLGALVVVTGFETRRLEARFPPVGAFAEVDGVRLHYSIAGPEDQGVAPIVLLHGASTSLLDFHASLLPPLAERHRVIALDRPGHGYSERASPASKDWPDPAEQARLLHGLLAQLQVEQPVLVGHSWAGAVVLAYLLAYPDEAAGGVLLAGGSHPWEGGVAWYNDLAGLPVVGDLFAYTLPLTFGRLGLGDGLAECLRAQCPAAWVSRADRRRADAAPADLPRQRRGYPTPEPLPGAPEHPTTIRSAGRCC
jgi:pimeloyl-ACP methyl ester carboxylesterase